MSRALLALPLLALALPAPALARDSDDDLIRTAKQLQDPRTQDTLAAVLSAMVGAMLDAPVGGIVNAVAKADPTGRTRPVDPDMTVADMAARDNPDFADDLDADIRGGTRLAGAMAGAMADLLPQLSVLARDVEERVEAARNAARRY